MTTTDIEPLLVFADSLREAQLWAADHGYANVPGRLYKGLCWIYAHDWSHVLGRQDGLFIDLRTESWEPQGAAAWLLHHGFTEVQP